MKKIFIAIASIAALNASSSVAEVVQRPSLGSRIWTTLTSCFTPHNIDRTLEYLDSAAQAATAVTAIVAPQAADEMKYVASIVHAASVAYDPPKEGIAGGAAAGATPLKLEEIKIEPKAPQTLRFGN